MKTNIVPIPKPSSAYNNNNRSEYNASTSPEEYHPMVVPEHIYLAGAARRTAPRETRPQMSVPTRIIVGGGDTTVASKAQPTEVLRERQTILPSSDQEGMNIGGIPETLTANELPQEDYDSQKQQHQTPENPHYSSQTSIAVDKDPLNELKVMRRRLNQLVKRVQNLELESKGYKDERPYLIAAGILLAGTLVASMLHTTFSRK